MAWTASQMPDQSGKTVIVTGGNGGLGLETGREMARRGAHVIIAARNLDKAAKAEADIRGKLPDASIEVRQLDLASKSSIKAFADSITGDFEAIDILFNNAGVMALPEGKTEDGFEMQFGTNHLGHFYLTYLLMPLLLNAAEARIVNTTSTARFSAGEYDLSNAHSEGNYKPWEAYGISKRANLHFAMELNNRLAAAGAAAKAYSADPGFSNTDLQAASARASGGGISQGFFAKAVPIVGQNAARGALPQLQAGTDPTAPGGALFRPRWVVRGDSVQGKIGDKLSKPQDLKELWDISEKDMGIDFDVAAMVAAAK
ncbi:MAG: SDR family NAD(P)-dependent oxidoreductase [Acidimicrobiia bacterium]|nr:SDR family NAD(P)-dependent oxidoreductase [Acidimicrobiia bacterium]